MSWNRGNNRNNMHGATIKKIMKVSVYVRIKLRYTYAPRPHKNQNLLVFTTQVYSFSTLQSLQGPQFNWIGSILPVLIQKYFCDHHMEVYETRGTCGTHIDDKYST